MQADRHRLLPPQRRGGSRRIASAPGNRTGTRDSHPRASADRNLHVLLLRHSPPGDGQSAAGVLSRWTSGATVDQPISWSCSPYPPFGHLFPGGRRESVVNSPDGVALRWPASRAARLAKATSLRFATQHDWRTW